MIAPGRFALAAWLSLAVAAAQPDPPLLAYDEWTENGNVRWGFLSLDADRKLVTKLAAQWFTNKRTSVDPAPRFVDGVAQFKIDSGPNAPWHFVTGEGLPAHDRFVLASAPATPLRDVRILRVFSPFDDELAAVHLLANPSADGRRYDLERDTLLHLDGTLLTPRRQDGTELRDIRGYTHGRLLHAFGYKKQFYRRQGAFWTPCGDRFDLAKLFVGDHAAVGFRGANNTEQWDVIDRGGDRVFNRAFESINLVEGDSPWVPVKQDGRWHYYGLETASRCDLPEYSPRGYQRATPFVDGHAAVKRNGEWLILDQDTFSPTKVQLDEIYEVHAFAEGLAAAETEDGWFYVDTDGNPKWPDPLEGVAKAYGFEGGFARLIVHVDGLQRIAYLSKCTGAIAWAPLPPPTPRQSNRR